MTEHEKGLGRAKKPCLALSPTELFVSIEYSRVTAVQLYEVQCNKLLIIYQLKTVSLYILHISALVNNVVYSECNYHIKFSNTNTKNIISSNVNS